MSSLKRAGLLLVTALLLGDCGFPSPPSDELLGKQAPNFVLPNLNSEKVELAGLTSQKPTLLIFWATWCPTCNEEIPTLKEWHQKYPQLQLLAINVQEPAGRVRAFAEKRGIRYPILLDSEAEVAHQYGLVGIPASVLIAKGGRILYYGFTLPQNIEQLVGPSPPA